MLTLSFALFNARFEKEGNFKNTFTLFLDYLGSIHDYAINRTASQSSVDNSNAAENAVDNDLATYMQTTQEDYPWWTVDLEYPVFVAKVHIVNPDCCLTQMDQFKILVSRRVNGELITASCGGSDLLSIKDMPDGSFSCTPPIYGNNVTIRIDQTNHVMNMAEVKVYGKLFC